jgi:hypothetical protein
VAAAGDIRWERAPAESGAPFRARTRAAVEAAGVAFIHCFGAVVQQKSKR